MTTLQRRSPVATALVTLGAGFQSARVRRHLRRADEARDGQHQAWRARRDDFSRTEFGRAAGVERGLPYETFRQRVALRGYEQFAPWIERMKRGEPDLLVPGSCARYAVSSGTTAGRTKYLPVPPAMLAHFRRAGLASLFWYTARAGHARVFQGRHLFLGGSTALARLPGDGRFEAWAGDLSGIAAMNLPAWAEQLLYEPGREVAQMGDWSAKLQAIAGRTMCQDITLLAGIPSWLLILGEVLQARSAARPLTRLWPNLECVVHGGVPLAPFAAELRELVGPTVNFHEVYPASEAFIAAQDAEAEAGLRLLTGAGVFYEFLPRRRFDEHRLDELGSHAVPLEGVRPGEDYVILLTTPGGLCRYVIGDVVRFVSAAPPRLVYVGRTRLELSAFGEHVIEKELTDVLAQVGARRGLNVANFHVAPIFVDTAANRTRGAHEWWIELRPGPSGALRLGELVDELDAALQAANDDYEGKRKGGGLDRPRVRLVASGTFELWMRRQGRWGGQSKMPRCRSDRAIADELAALADAE